MNLASDHSDHSHPSDDESTNAHETVVKQSPKRPTPIIVPIVTLLKGNGSGTYSY